MIIFIIPNPRILTVREYARIQTFPDWFEIKKKYTTGGTDEKGRSTAIYSDWKRDTTIICRTCRIGFKRNDVKRMENQLQFRISSALKNLIGKELITDEFVAVFELVKKLF